MARSIWKGAIAFGLVNIPVGLTSAESRPDIPTSCGTTASVLMCRDTPHGENQVTKRICHIVRSRNKPISLPIPRLLIPLE